MNNKINLMVFFIISMFVSISCVSNEDEIVDTTNPFDTISVSNNNTRDKIVVISDLHLGHDLSYSENVNHLKRLQEFLIKIKTSRTVKELILNGDILDEWYIPTRTDTYNGGTQADFVIKTVNANKDVFKLLNEIINDKKIKLTYIPGNHDMGFTKENINLALNGVNQARDSDEKYGIGTYHPDDYPQIAIEHGHRYDFFCNITPLNNGSETQQTTFGPGYFFARIAANSFTNPINKGEATLVSGVTLIKSNEPEEVTKFNYYQTWEKVMNNLVYVKEDFNEPIIKTGIGGFTKTYSINDILPYNDDKGSIQIKLYNNIFTQDKWNERLKYNNVYVMTNINQAIEGSLETEFIDMQSNTQYFSNKNSQVRLVIFGHTHLPKILQFRNNNYEQCVYANSGTWEDKKVRDKTQNVVQDGINMNFIILSPIKGNKNNINVGLYKYLYGNHFLLDQIDVAF